ERLEQVRQEQQKNKQNPRYDGVCRRIDPGEATRRVAAGDRHVIRFKMPTEGAITVTDLLRGEIVVENSSLDDSILVKSDGLALYHLAAMVDDHAMGVTHVIRGSEWLSTFPLHGHILRAFGWELPVFVHLSIFLKPSGKGKMSKRESAEAMKDGHSIFVTDLIELGYLPEAVRNWTALMGWSYDDHTEFFSMDDLIAKFGLERLNPAPAAINFTKLDYFNGAYIRGLAVDDLARRIQPFMHKAGFDADLATLERIAPLVQERLVTLDDAPQWIGFFFQQQVNPADADLLGSKMSAADSAAAAQRALQVLEGLPELSLEQAEPPLRALADALGLQAGQLFGILRAAVTGQKVSPPLFESIEIIGREKVLARLRAAAERLAALA
ncbi:MAG: glutamate--tRNA ligase, partial [Chloroflexota bacterium]